ELTAAPGTPESSPPLRYLEAFSVSKGSRCAELHRSTGNLRATYRDRCDDPVFPPHSPRAGRSVERGSAGQRFAGNAPATRRAIRLRPTSAGAVLHLAQAHPRRRFRNLHTIAAAGHLGNPPGDPEH